MITPPGMGIRDEARRQLAKDIGLCSNDTWRFFTTLLDAPTPFKSHRELAAALGLNDSTLLSRFWRHRLPRPKLYVAHVFFMRVAAGRCATLFEATALFGYSHPQSMHRAIQGFFGCTGKEFLETETGYTMLRRFREELILPYADTLQSVQLLAPLDLSRRRSRAEAAA